MLLCFLFHFFLSFFLCLLLGFPQNPKTPLLWKNINQLLKYLLKLWLNFIKAAIEEERADKVGVAIEAVIELKEEEDLINQEEGAMVIDLDQAVISK